MDLSLLSLSSLLNKETEKPNEEKRMSLEEVLKADHLSQIHPMNLPSALQTCISTVSRDGLNKPELTNFESAESYCMCSESSPTAPVTPKVALKSEGEFKFLTKNDQDVIEKLAQRHSNERSKCKSAMEEHLATFESGETIVVKAKQKVLRRHLENEDDFRGSSFRGVSVNGKSFQVFIVINKVKRYAGCVPSKLEAAFLYDKLALVYHGLKVRFSHFN